MANPLNISPLKSKEEIFVIGDIHGCAAELRQLLQQLPLDANSTVVFVGDYIDRGPDSKGVIDIILDFKAIYNVVTLMGNHEEMLLDFIADPQSSSAGDFIYNGGSATLASYSQGNSDYHIPESHLEFFKSLRLFYQTEKYFIVHAGVPDIELDKIDPVRDKETLLWIRSAFHKSSFRWKKLIVHGHSVVDQVDIHPKRINVDTGCVFQGRLSAMALNSQRIYSVSKDSPVPHTYLHEPGTPRIATRFKGQIPVRMKKGSQSLRLETINYNEFGLLLKQVDLTSSVVFSPLENVSGEIELTLSSMRKFTGEIVRADITAERPKYAIKILSLEAMNE